MSTGEIFVPNPQAETEKLLVVERALGENGLIDTHLRWVGADESPTSGISTREYGYLPQRFNADNTGYRPSREPLDFQDMATTVLGLPYDTPYATLAQRIQQVDTDWFGYLVKASHLDENQADAMKNAANTAYRLDTLTEDNLPAYVSILFGGLKALADKQGIKIPATEEWSRGIWTAEENGHMLSMNEYGKATGIINTPEHAAGRNSQLRAGIEVELQHVIQLFTYVSWQELSTNIAHLRNGKLFGPVGYELLDHVGKDEARHHYIYQSILAELYEIFPDDTLQTLEAVLARPFMPGSKGIPDFVRRAARIHGSAIFGVEHAYEAAQKVLQKLGVLNPEKDRPGLSQEAVNARTRLREQYGNQTAPERRRTAKFILDSTIGITELSQARKAFAKEVGLAA